MISLGKIIYFNQFYEPKTFLKIWMTLKVPDAPFQRVFTIVIRKRLFGILNPRGLSNFDSLFHGIETERLVGDPA